MVAGRTATALLQRRCSPRTAPFGAALGTAAWPLSSLHRASFSSGSSGSAARQDSSLTGRFFGASNAVTEAAGSASRARSAFSTASAAGSASARASTVAPVRRELPSEVPVAITGGGPTGLALSILLSRYGVQHVLLERAGALTAHPQAHLINMRTMEVFRGMDGLADEVVAKNPPLAQWRNFVYCETLTGRIYGLVDHFKGQADPWRRHLSPAPVAHLSQHKLLPLMLQRAAATPPGLAAIRMGCGLAGWRQEGDWVALRAADAGGGVHNVRARYLVAADGASSSVRQQLGIPLEGDPAVQHLVNVHFVSRHLASLLTVDRPGMLYFVFGPQAIMVLVAHNLNEGEFVAQIPYFPPLQSLADFPPETCHRMICDAAGLSNLDAKIIAVKTWTMNAQVAARYQSGNVFLAGDAAHRFPPSGAFGMNTGVQDAHNLAWKLAAVVHGAVPASLLRSYETERRPVALANTALSVANWHQAVRVPVALGLDPQMATKFNRAVAAAPLPTFLGKALLETGLSIGRSLSGAQGPVKGWREAQLKKIFDSGDTLRLQFPREDLGFRYTAGAVCADDPACAAAASSDQGATKQEQQQQGRGAEFVPSIAPGCRLPHCSLTLGSGAEESTIDMVARLPATRLLLVLSGDRVPRSTAQVAAAAGEDPATLPAKAAPAAGRGSTAWLEAAAQAAAAGAPIDVLVIEQGRAAAIADGSSTGSVAAAVPPGLKVVWATDAAGAWPAVREVLADGAVLVRPDGHVAWRRYSAPPDAAAGAKALADAVGAIGLMVVRQ